MKYFWLLFSGLCLSATSLAQVATPATEDSVKPGINEKFLDPNLKVDDWLKRFEVESREVFHARQEVLDACEVKKEELRRRRRCGDGAVHPPVCWVGGW